MEERIQRQTPKLQQDGECTRLISKRQQAGAMVRTSHSTNRGHFCITSKAAIMTLVWSTCASFLLSMLDPSLYFGMIAHKIQFPVIYLAIVIYVSLAVAFIFFPIGGFFADVCCGRYKTVVCSLWILLVVLLIAVVVTFLFVSLINHADLVFFISIAIASPLAVVGFVGYFANVIQFGLDQLQDSPAEDSTLYIHWHVWIYYFWVILGKVMASTVMCNKHLVPLILSFIPWPYLCFVTLLVTLSLTCSRRIRQWFIVDPGSRNPYRLVYRVLKFAYNHKYPIRRSAFTYCEDELPSRIDLGKTKYGGPFTTEEVEDVKALIGIVRVLITFGPFFIVDLAAVCLLPVISLHLFGDYCHTNRALFVVLQQATLTPILIVILIPVYIFLLRRYINHYIPSMLKRMGIGMVLALLSLLTTFATHTAAHVHHSNSTCIFQLIELGSSTNHTITPILKHMYTLIFLPQNIFNALGYMFFYIAAYEFVCAQTPHSMKGFIIGVFFAIKGTFQLFGFASIFIPFTQWGLHAPFPSCAFVYYLINIAIAIFGIVAYTLAAKRYQYRQRDEPSNVRRFVENYYEQTGDESQHHIDCEGHSEF